ncbi:hypothetical protein [Corynebacterium ulcerans]|uniref:hypothetical protein n=1 Tax=Corynebacterium ulcerans TaxID=65058 RepID=UPI00215511E2|nr:hypothetical protein [Corynebacterium ulcerans]
MFTKYGEFSYELLQKEYFVATMRLGLLLDADAHFRDSLELHLLVTLRVQGEHVVLE